MVIQWVNRPKTLSKHANACKMCLADLHICQLVELAGLLWTNTLVITKLRLKQRRYWRGLQCCTFYHSFFKPPNDLFRLTVFFDVAQSWLITKGKERRWGVWAEGVCSFEPPPKRKLVYGKATGWPWSFNVQNNTHFFITYCDAGLMLWHDRAIPSKLTKANVIHVYLRS